jgi:hypothetical protein
MVHPAMLEIEGRGVGIRGSTGWDSEKSFGFLVWIFSLIMYWSFLNLNFVVPTGGRNTSFILRCVVSSLFCWNLARFELWNGAELLQRFFPNDCRQLRECGAGSHSSVAATWEKVDADYQWLSMIINDYHIIILWKHPVQEPCQVNLVFRAHFWAGLWSPMAQAHSSSKQQVQGSLPLS